jgi:murein DD-endopeptidase MepM/ murein hydrolase activator NlpD
MLEPRFLCPILALILMISFALETQVSTFGLSMGDYSDAPKAPIINENPGNESELWKLVEQVLKQILESISTQIEETLSKMFSELLKLFYSIGKTLQPPPTPVLKSPADSSTTPNLTPKLEWHSSNGATSYWLQVSTDPVFSNLVINQSGMTKTYYDIPPGKLKLNTIYYWRVKASNAGGASSWSSYWSFRTPKITEEDLSKRIFGAVYPVTLRFLDPLPKSIGTGAHAGIDYAAPRGTVVKSATSGKVIKVAEDVGGVFIYDGANTIIYLHMTDIKVKVDDSVSIGTELGKVGSTGIATGPHLHLEVRKGYSEYATSPNAGKDEVEEKNLNPNSYIGMNQ